MSSGKHELHVVCLLGYKFLSTGSLSLGFEDREGGLWVG